MLLLLDNYDSFTYNVYQFLSELGADVDVIRHDKIRVADVVTRGYEAVVISPGPGEPKDAGITEDLIGSLKDKLPILGICLGHQAICTAFGATVTYAKELMHGKQSEVKFDTDCPLFKDCPQAAPVARYHSLAADADTIPEELKITARTTDGEVMAIQHKEYPIYGVQFHPESIMTPDGKQMLNNFIKEI